MAQVSESSFEVHRVSESTFYQGVLTSGLVAEILIPFVLVGRCTDFLDVLPPWSTRNIGVLTSWLTRTLGVLTSLAEVSDASF